jgi:hypothetical protein
MSWFSSVNRNSSDHSYQQLQDIDTTRVVTQEEGCVSSPLYTAQVIANKVEDARKVADVTNNAPIQK